MTTEAAAIELRARRCLHEAAGPLAQVAVAAVLDRVALQQDVAQTGCTVRHRMGVQLDGRVAGRRGRDADAGGGRLDLAQPVCSMRTSCTPWVRQLPSCATSTPAARAMPVTVLPRSVMCAPPTMVRPRPQRAPETVLSATRMSRTTGSLS